MENNILSFVNPNQNDKFSNMTESDVKELMRKLSFYFLELRKSLSLDSYITFGLELEFENILNLNKLKEEFVSIKFNELWDLGSDATLTKGAEIISPILTDSFSTWQELEKVCELAKTYGEVGKSSAAHVHVGTQTIGEEKEAWLNFIKLWAVYENVIYRFTDGEFLTGLPGISLCFPSREEFLKDYKLFEETLIEEFFTTISHRRGRSRAVNLGNVKNGEYIEGNTIEFRCPNGTLNPVIWQNNVNLFVRLLLYSKNLSKYDYDTIEKRRLSTPENLPYCKIYLDQALELCDLIFTDNLSKIYFMKQYLKGFRTSNESMKRAREFTTIRNS